MPVIVRCGHDLPPSRRPPARRAPPHVLRARLHRDGRRVLPRHASAAPGCCAPRRSTRTCPAGCRASGKGWVTAEYSMLPGLVARADPARGEGRQAVRPHPGDPAPHRPGAAGRVRHARAGRAPGHRRLRRAPGRRRHPHRVDLRRLRRAARRAHPAGAGRARSPTHPLTAFCAAISVGIVDGQPVLDLPYVEDSQAEVDMNVVMTSLGGFVEVQGTAEGAPYSREPSSTRCSALAEAGIAEIIALQREMVAVPPAARGEAAAPRHGQRPQGRGGRRRSSGAGVEVEAPRHRRRGDRRPPSRRTRCSRPAPSPAAPASWPWPTTPASRSTTSAAARASTRPAGPPRTTGSRACCASSTASRRRPGLPLRVRRRGGVARRPRGGRAAARSRAASPTRRAATAGSATTRSWSRSRATAARSPR